MAIFGSFGHCLPNILYGHTTAFKWYNCQWPWAYFKVTGLFHITFLKNGAWYGKSYYRPLIGNHTLAFDWCHLWWPWSIFEGHFSLVCHFHVQFSNPWHTFASHGLPAIAELLVFLIKPLYFTVCTREPSRLPACLYCSLLSCVECFCCYVLTVVQLWYDGRINKSFTNRIKIKNKIIPVSIKCVIITCVPLWWRLYMYPTTIYTTFIDRVYSRQL